MLMPTMMCRVTSKDLIELLLKKDENEYVGVLVSVKKTLDGPENQTLVLDEPLRPTND